jgi:L-histidine N-alpha-methyltransferase
VTSTIIASGGGSNLDLFAAEVGEYLQRTPRQLPSKYFYDALGSSLFEAICKLPWYRITRAESTLLETHAAEILQPLPRPFSVAELGCGSGGKLARLLERGAAECCQIHLIDISTEALDRARDRLRLVRAHHLHAHALGYEEGLSRVSESRGSDGPLMVLFLGSNIGNFDPPAARALLTCMRAALRPGDWLLLGNDLVKPERDLLLAYDDPLQVTAAFNRNLLRRINDELGGTFDLDGFAHRALWNARQSRVEMHLVSGRRQPVRIDASGLEVVFEPGEPIWTESSYKYEPEAVIAEGLAAGFSRAQQWIDPDARFALTRFSV